VTLTIQDIVENPNLRTTFLAGRSGAQRKVDWAHNTEVEEPWQWLSAGELLLTLGRNFPAEPGDQISFIKNLSDAGIAGLDLAAGWFAPELTPEATKFADDLGFPIIQTAYEIPFVLLARSVAEETSRTKQQTKILRMYESFRQSSLQRKSEEEQLLVLSEFLSSKLAILNTKTFRAILPFDFKISKNLVSQIKSARVKAPLPAVFRVKDGDTNYLLVSMGEDEQSLLVQTDTDEIDLIMLQHTASVVSFVAERHLANIGSQTTSGHRLLSQLLDNLVDRELAKERLSQFNLESGPWEVACISSELITDLDFVNTMLIHSKVPAIASIGSQGLIILTHADFEWSEDFLDALSGPQCTVGISAQINSLGRLADGAREANWARELAKTSKIRISKYGDTDSIFMPRTVSGAQVAVETILGPLIEYDNLHNAELMKSLHAFFDANMSWQHASMELGIHRQTLNYRMQRIAEITNRNVSEISGLAELHFATRAKEILDQI
jgi:purine catabolism regulator